MSGRYSICANGVFSKRRNIAIKEDAPDGVGERHEVSCMINTLGLYKMMYSSYNPFFQLIQLVSLRPVHLHLRAHIVKRCVGTLKELSDSVSKLSITTYVATSGPVYAAKQT